MNPKVSFVVPCYNLAHLLPDCIESILSQSYGDYEVLIMDDCSPDRTPEVAQSFGDPRVRHIRNEHNLGHLKNYNKGIGLAGGEYVWLISADDRLRRPYVLERYVNLLDNHPEVGYVFCPAVAIEEGRETKFLDYSAPAERDMIFRGHDFLKILLKFDCVVAASSMARKACYEKLGLFPLNLLHSGDWYMWGLFALHYDVGYFAEPMVNYRHHDLAMTNLLKNRDIYIWINDDIATLQRFKEHAKAAGHTHLLRHCRDAIVSTCKHEGDRAYWRHDFSHALEYYRVAIKYNPRIPSVWMKYLLLHMGTVGTRLRGARSGIRRLAKAMQLRQLD